MNVLVSGGGTTAPIDDVRSITNASTGRFSAEITEAWLDRGAAVWHVHARSAQLPLLRDAGFDVATHDPAAEHDRIEILRSRYQQYRDQLHFRPLKIGTVADYSRILEQTLQAATFDVVMLAMAASDFEPEPHSGKIRSDSGSMSLTLHPTAKVIRSVRAWAPATYIVGFKLLHGEPPEALIAAADAANAVNRADLTVANDLQLKQREAHTLHLVRPGHPVETLGPRADLAAALVERIAVWVQEKEARSKP